MKTNLKPTLAITNKPNQSIKKKQEKYSPIMHIAKLLLLGIFSLSLFACGTPQDKAISELNSLGFKLNQKDFFQAVKNKNHHVAKLYIQANYDINSVDFDQKSSLHRAVENNDLEMVKILVNGGSELDHYSSDNSTPLLTAVDKNNTEIVNFLLKNNANAELANKDGWSPLLKAVDNNNFDLAKTLTPYSANKQIDEVFLVAAKKGNTGFVDFLLNNGAYINFRSKDKNTALMFSSAFGHIDTVQTLIKRGANRYLMNKENMTAAMIAEKYSHDKIYEFLSQVPEETNIEKDFFAEENSTEETQDEGKVELQDHTDPGFFAYNNEDKKNITNANANANANAIHLAGTKKNNMDYETAVRNKLMRLNNAKLPPTNNNTNADNIPAQNLAKRMVMRRYHEEEIPFYLQNVNESQKTATIQQLYGQNQTYQVHFGEYIPGTDYQVTGGKYKNTSSKANNNETINMSEVYLTNAKNGGNYTINTVSPGRASEPYAVLELKDDNSQFDARVNDRFYDVTTNEDYEVIDVRPNEIIVRSINSGETFVIPNNTL